VPETPVRYRSPDEDSGRWTGFPFRGDDIVISSRSKSGTTWIQMICALLIFQDPVLPDSLDHLSPWLDWLITPRGEAYARLAAQRHRRFIKTHTPLDGIPLDPRATYIVSARHPLDMAVSLYHQGANLDRARLRQLAGRPEPKAPEQREVSPPLHEWLSAWIDQEVDPREELDSLPGILWHVTDAWQRRSQAGVVLVHYDDLCRDLNGEMRRLSDRLGITVPERRWPELVEAATFASMRTHASRLAPGPPGILKDRVAFFRRGSSGAGTEELSRDEVRHYHRRVAELAPADLLAWLHRDTAVEH
jgi:aryl sulfotransferase